MQNNDGGWAAFERNNNNRFISWLPLDGADDAATDPSSADLTGRTLEYLGHTLGLKNNHPFIRQAVAGYTSIKKMTALGMAAGASVTFMAVGPH